MGKARFEDIYRELRGLVVCGGYPNGALLPSESELTQQFSCSRSTVRRALAALERDGMALPIQGKGVRVIFRGEDAQGADLKSVETFWERTTRNRQRGSTTVTRFGTIVTDGALSRTTGFRVGTELLWVDRVRRVNGEPVILDRNYFRKSEVPGLTPEICADSVYAYLERKLGMQITTSKRRITVERATARDRAWLDLKGFDCLAVVTSSTYNSSGVMFEYTQSRHHPRYFEEFPYCTPADRLVRKKEA